MSKYEDWTDWAGDHPQQAEEDLRKERERAEESFARVVREGLLHPSVWGAAVIVEATEDCGHTEVYPNGKCADCGEWVEDFEPSDAQIPGTYEIQGSAA